MASIRQVSSKDGTISYKVSVSNGRGRRVTRTWTPQPTWSSRTKQRELYKYAADLENSLAAGETTTRKEDKERERHEALEAAKIKTLRQYAEGIFMPLKTEEISENTRSSYQGFLDLHILPALGDHLVSEITPAMLQSLILRYRKGHSYASTVKLYNILNGIMKMAFDDETIQANPMFRVSRPKQGKDAAGGEKEAQAYSVDEVRKILSCLEQEPLKWRVYIWLLVDTGMRRGEACGLQWKDVDFEKSVIEIVGNLQYTPEKGVYLCAPKNGRTRSVDIGEELLAMLRQLRAEQSRECLAKYVFTQDGTTEPMHPQTPTRYFTKFGKRYGIDQLHPHKLRHTT